MGSNKLKMLLEKLNVKFQSFPVKIFESNTKIMLNDYYVFNIIEVIDALCLEKSDYSIFTTKSKHSLTSIKKYAVYSSKLKGIHVFKLGNGHETPIFVSEIFKKEVEINNLSGMNFLKVRVV